jgi:hypothetical protein
LYQHRESRLEGVPMALVVRRELQVPIAATGADQERLSSYLALVDRPLSALLARERLIQEGPGLFHYRSRPFRVLQLEFVPSLSLAASWRDGQLAIESRGCQITGLGPWGRSLGFRLRAGLMAADRELRGWTDVGLNTGLVDHGAARQLAQVALEAVLDRIEARLGRGLRRDVVSWLASGTESSGKGGLN